MINVVVKTANEIIKECFPDSVVYGVATPTNTKDSDGKISTIPVIVDFNGECQYIDPEDNNILTVYHRLISSQYPQVNKGVGDGKAASIVYDMILVCFGSRRKSKKTVDEVERKILSSIPIKISGANISFISSDFDQNRIMSSEFPNVENFLTPEQFLFSMRYRITCNYNSKSCII